MSKKTMQKRTDFDVLMKQNPDGMDPWRIFRIMTEFVAGFDFLQQYKRAATLFGSARFAPDHPTYKEAEKVAAYLASCGFAIVTGGGPGIMEAANKGAHDVGGESVGLCIRVPYEPAANKFVKEFTRFKYFFTRKVMLVYASEVYLFFPGGFGTLDEFFELITLIQTGKIARVPIVLIDEEFWRPMIEWVDRTLVGTYLTVREKETSLFHLVKDGDAAISYLKQTLKLKTKR